MPLEGFILEHGHLSTCTTPMCRLPAEQLQVVNSCPNTGHPAAPMDSDPVKRDSARVEPLILQGYENIKAQVDKSIEDVFDGSSL